MVTGIRKLSIRYQAAAALLPGHKAANELTNCCVRPVYNFIHNFVHSKCARLHTSTRQGSQQV